MNKNDERISESIFKDAARQYELESLGREKLARHITRLSIILWLLSLALPGFLADGKPQYGIYILLIGVPLGWLGGVVAPYANVFYLYALVSLGKDEIPVKSLVLMVVLAGTTVFVRRILVDEGGGTASITSWGWGAIIWGISMLLLVVATLVREYRLSSRGAVLIFWLIGAVLLAVFVLNRYQWSNANIQDRYFYLSPSMAFSTVKLCGIPVAQVAGPIVPEGENISIDPSMDEFMGPGVRGSYPLLTYFEKNGYEWVYRNQYPDYEIGRKSEIDARPPRFLLRAVKNSPETIIQLVDARAKKAVHEQRVVYGPYRSNNRCPSATGDLGYLQAIRKAAGQDQAKAYFAGPRPIEEGRVPCNAEYEMPQHGGARKPIKYCSSHYVAIWYPLESPIVGKSVYLNVMILDRKSLTLVGSYSSYLKCPSEDCVTASTKEITGFRVDDSRVYLLTNGGELVTNLQNQVK
jgi:hypothetical protein